MDSVRGSFIRKTYEETPMRAISPSAQAKLDRSASTFCNCWRLVRRDGVVMGFTDHDRDLTFSNVVFRAHTGMTASEVESCVGFAAVGGEAAGALQADSLAEDALLSGLYDGASVEIWLVDWTSVEDRVLLDVATIGEVTRSEFSFSAELRSSAHYFDQQRGVAFQRACSADLGDPQCKFNIATPGFSTRGAVVSSADELIVADLNGVFETGFFGEGRLIFSSGANAGARVSIKSHSQSGLRASFTGWTRFGGAISVGDSFTVVAGCDKSPDACRSKFNNLINFRGFPHMPGNDRVIAYPSSLAPAMDGGSFFR
jgi:uncharacterized phage protein (TIGR02218 family)